MEDLHLSVARDYTDTPGPRYRAQGRYSGEELRDTLLELRFLEAVKCGVHLVVDLDGTASYATSFLEEAFAGLARKHGKGLVLQTLVFKSDEEPELIPEVRRYVEECDLEVRPGNA